MTRGTLGEGAGLEEEADRDDVLLELERKLGEPEKEDEEIKAGDTFGDKIAALSKTIAALGDSDDEEDEEEEAGGRAEAMKKKTELRNVSDQCKECSPLLI